MRAPFLISLVAAAWIGACVGDDPSISSGNADAGADAGGDAGGGAMDASASEASATDAGNGDAGTDAVAAFTPATLPGLALWLDANEPSTLTLGGGNVVTLWKDRSTQMNDAAQSGTGTVHLVSSVVEFGGKNVLEFADGPLVVADSTSLRWGDTDEFLVVLAGYHTATDTTDRFFFAKFDTQTIGPALLGGAGAHAQLAGALLDYSDFLAGTGGTGVVAPAATNDGKQHIFAIRRLGGAGTTLQLRIDGVATAATVTARLASTAEPLVIGAMRTPGGALVNLLVGRIAEVVAVHGALTEAQVGAVEVYLHDKYKP